MAMWQPMEGETPIDPSHLKDNSIKTRKQLNLAEAQNILIPLVKYLVAKPSKKVAPFDLNWFQQLHEEMFCDVWDYAGQFRRVDLNIGVKWPEETIGFEKSVARDAYLSAVKQADTGDFSQLIDLHKKYLDKQK